MRAASEPGVPWGLTSGVSEDTEAWVPPQEIPTELVLVWFGHKQSFKAPQLILTNLESKDGARAVP